VSGRPGDVLMSVYGSRGEKWDFFPVVPFTTIDTTIGERIP
jgi:hypothetical protein